MTDLHPTDYSEARDAGEVVEQAGYHQPQNYTYRQRGCGCSLDTAKGAYRDVSVQMPDGRVIHYYHQSPVVVVADGRYRLSGCGYRTRTTKERINDRLPSGYRLEQEDYEWYLKQWNPQADYEEREYTREPFEDGMVIEP